MYTDTHTHAHVRARTHMRTHKSTQIYVHIHIYRCRPLFSAPTSMQFWSWKLVSTCFPSQLQRAVMKSMKIRLGPFLPMRFTTRAKVAWPIRLLSSSRLFQTSARRQSSAPTFSPICDMVYLIILISPLFGRECNWKSTTLNDTAKRVAT